MIWLQVWERAQDSWKQDAIWWIFGCILITMYLGMGILHCIRVVKVWNATASVPKARLVMPPSSLVVPPTPQPQAPLALQPPAPEPRPYAENNHAFAIAAARPTRSPRQIRKRKKQTPATVPQPKRPTSWSLLLLDEEPENILCPATPLAPKKRRRTKKL